MVNVLGIDLFEYDIERASSLILEQCQGERRNRCVSATGAHGIIVAKKEPDFETILNSFYLNLPDGMPSVWIGRLKGAGQMRRCYGPDFFKDVLSRTSGRPINHFLCGGAEGVSAELKKVCAETFQNVHVVGVSSPPFRDMSDAEVRDLAREIDSRGTDIVWIGISTPKQERFASRLSRETKVYFLCTVGAAFDFHVGRVAQSPKWIQRIGMEWFFRLTREPRRLWKRYAEIVPLFLWYNLVEFGTGRFFRSKEKKHV